MPMIWIKERKKEIRKERKYSVQMSNRSIIKESNWNVQLFRTTLTFEGRRYLPDFDGRSTWKLAQNHLQQVEWLSNNNEDYYVGYEKSTSAIFVSGERKSPDITQSNWHGYAGHQKFFVVSPLRPFRLIKRRVIRGWKKKISFHSLTRNKKIRKGKKEG